MIEGSIVALVTPMEEDGAIDWQALERLIDFHLENGTNAIVAVGTSGESPTLPVDEHIAVIAATVQRVAGRIPVIAGTGSNATSEAVEWSQSAKEVGADACLLVTPYYNRPTQEGMYQHFKLIADSVDIPQILYNVPGRTTCDLLPDTLERLAYHPNIIGIKEATGDLERGREVLERCSDRLTVYSGDDATAMELILMGAKGDISVTANVAPKKMAEMCRAAIAGDRETAERINAKLEALHRDLFVEANPIPVKWAVEQLGLIKGGIRLPLTRLSQQYHEMIHRAMQQAEVI
ncbi:MAG: 4-hydroxy-tetrahydrodipicolinate synthase [Pseudomonadales bacterium]|nr:4-hydroxy-tetrahydrodipicolinate synthase [Pseudomonadales bacterium]MCP5215581.1 4-hydroxy-tetrahydrodipicolinate synthase [Pseudomonadales bacterium]